MRRSSVILALTFCSGAVNALPLPADDLPSVEVFPLDVSPTNTTNTTSTTNTTTSADPAQNSTTPDSGDQITSVKIFDLVVNDDAPPPPSDAVV